jgi:signal transduction histidine kinase
MENRRFEWVFDLLPMVLTLPLLVVVIAWNLQQATGLAERWFEREAQEIGREAVADFLPELRLWVSDGQRFVEALATGPVLAAALRSADGWQLAPSAIGAGPEFERWATTGSCTLEVRSGGQVFLRWPLRLGPPAGRGGGPAGVQGGGPPPWSRGRQRGTSGPDDDGGFAEGPPHDRMSGRGPFELALLVQVPGVPPVWPFHAQAVLWALAWLAAGSAWVWGRRGQRRARLLEIKGQHEAHLAAIGRLSARLAHEIRNPLGMVRGAAQHLRQGGLAEAEQDSLLTLIEQETRRLEDLTRAVLSYCRPPSVTPTPMDLAAFLRDFARQAALDREQPPLVLDALPETCRVQADADALRQVLWNLVRNAREATVAMGRMAPVHLSLAATPEGVAVRLRDQGPGLSPEASAHVFEPFFSSKTQGFGLGLAISRHLVESMGGRLTLVSAPEGGCLAEVLLLHDRSTP